MLILVAAGCTGTADFAPTTAQRPTVSSDTATTGEGTFELESGIALDPGDTIDTPTVVKWGAGPRTELSFGWSPHQGIVVPGDDAGGVGDLQVGTRHRFLEEGELHPSAAIQFTTVLPTGDRAEGLSTGEVDFAAAGIVTKTIGRATGTLFYEAGILGNQGGGTDLEHTMALAGSMALTSRWGVFAELSSVHNRESAVETYAGIVGGSYAFSERFVVDVGASIGLDDQAPDFQLLVGFTANLGAFPWFAAGGADGR